MADNLTLEWNDYAKKQVFIYTHLGQLVYQNTVSGSSVTIHLAQLPKGLYFLQLTDSKHSETHKIIKM